MEIILLEDVASLGNAGEIVNVKPGYARNFLFSHGLAVRSSKRNRAMINEKKAAIKARTNREAKVFEELLSQLKKIEITIEVEVGEDEKLFGSVTNKDIHKAILEKGIEIERNSIELEVPIKSLGIYDVNVNIAKGLSEKIKVYVIQA
jgi:large subunit ribosomal protein L9|tara:strand:+ start:235 stop:678 length:444 start_codon:yes stop_codon:yes gene_type:complete